MKKIRFRDVLKITKDHAAYKWWIRDLHMSVSDSESVFPTVTAKLVPALMFPSCVSSGMLLNTSGPLCSTVLQTPNYWHQWPRGGCKATYGCRWKVFWDQLAMSVMGTTMESGNSAISTIPAS